MKQEEFEFGSSSTLVEMIDRVFRTRIGYLLQLLARNYDHRYGFNYELGSKIGQYYSNVHATVMLNLFASCLLSEGEKGILQDALFLLRDSNPNAFYEKVEEDKYAWDVIEGPSAFSTALSTYALLLTRDNRMEEIGESIEWLLSQRNDSGIWPVFKKGDHDNYVTTFYTILALRLWRDMTSRRGSLEREIVSAFQAVQEFIGSCFITDGLRCFVPKYEADEMCLSNTIVCLYLLKLLDSSRFDVFYQCARTAIEQAILEDEHWCVSLLSSARADRIKTMYTYNPAYLLLLLRMGWNTTDRVVLKMLFQIVADLRSYWIREDTVYPWRSSDSVVQSFIFSISLHSVCTWMRRFIEANIRELETNLDKLVVGKDVFLCHASEDKEEYVRLLHNELQRSGISVWYDEGEIRWGDRITTKIDEGIRTSKLAIVCFSDSFLRKEWPESEFASLFSRQQAERRRIVLPLILNSKDRVLEKYQLLRGISYKEWNRDQLSDLASEIRETLR